MKNRIAILLAIGLLAQALAPLVFEVGRVPALVTHFFLHHHHEHHEHGDALTFVDFLAQHYGHQPHHDDTGKGHSNLPFHTGDSFHSGLLLALSCTPPLFEISGLLRFQRQIFGNEPFYSNLVVRDIFKPPLR